jgi:hypothetical protein
MSTIYEDVDAEKTTDISGNCFYGDRRGRHIYTNTADNPVFITGGSVLSTQFRKILPLAIKQQIFWLLYQELPRRQGNAAKDEIVHAYPAVVVHQHFDLAGYAKFGDKNSPRGSSGWCDRTYYHDKNQK